MDDNDKPLDSSAEVQTTTKYDEQDDGSLVETTRVVLRTKEGRRAEFKCASAVHPAFGSTTVT